MFHLTAITRRRDALFQTSTIGGRSLGRTDTAQLNALRTELMIWRALETAVREPLAVYATPSSGGMFNSRVALRQRVPGEARNAIAACFGALVNIKNVFVVDPDIDIFSDEQMDWALATRFQPDRDLVVMDGHAHAAARSVAAARRPRRRQGGVRPHLAVRHRHAAGDARARAAALCRPAIRSVEAALADGPKFFEELMSAVGSRDGREIVRGARSAARHAGARSRRRKGATASNQAPPQTS